MTTKPRHPAIDGGSHFIFSPENPVIKPTLNMTPDQVKDHLTKIGEHVEETYGHYGAPERSFIVHNPKNVNALHHLAGQLGQESAIVSNNGQHEMHYYNGPNAGSVRHGQGTIAHSAPPQDNYTAITLEDGRKHYFQHHFDWETPLQKNHNRALAKEIMKAVNPYIDIYTTFTDFLTKSDEIRTEGRVFVSMDGDNIGASVERAAMADDIATIVKQSEKIANGQKQLRAWANKHDADIYIDGGDDMAMTLPKKYVKDLDILAKEYKKVTGFTITIGIGPSISKAGHAMLYGKIRGKDQINEWSEDVDEYLSGAVEDMTPTEKLQSEGLLKARQNYPTKVGEASEDGKYIARHHKKAGILAWEYHPDIAKRYDEHIDMNRNKFVNAQHPDHHPVINAFFDNVRKNFYRHMVPASDGPGKPHEVRARHIKNLIDGQPGYKLSVKDPNTLMFAIAERHGTTPTSSAWEYNKNTNKVSDVNADKIRKSNFGGPNDSRQNPRNDLEILLMESGWQRSVGHEQERILSLFELVQNIRHCGRPTGSRSVTETPRTLAKNAPVRLVHYSKKTGLNSIDPAFMGTGIGRRGNESKHGRPQPDRSYFYLENTPPEDVVTGSANARYTAELDPVKQPLYDINADKDGLRGTKNTEDYLKAVKAAGYHGFHNPSSALPNAVALFHPHPVTEDTTYYKYGQT